MATEFISNSWLMPTNANAEANRVSNYSLSFDGSSQYIDLGNVYDNIFTSSNFTVSTWIYSTGNTSYDNFFNKGATVQFYLVSNKIQIYLAPSGIGVWPLESTATLSLNTWYNIVFTRSGNENKLYINGTLDNSATSTGSISSSTGSLTIGAYNGGSSYFWQGKLTEYSIFDYELSSSQVLELYGTGSAIGNPMAITNGRKPVAYYPLGNAAFNSEFLTPNGAEQDYVFNFVSSSSQFITLASSSTAITDWTQPYTISMWVNYTTSLSFDLMATFGVETGLAATSRYIMIGGSSGYLFTGVGDTDGGSTNIHFNIGSNLNDGNWHHLVYVGDGTSGDFPTVYIDGVVEAYSGGTTNLFNSSTYLNVIGTGSTASGRYFNGKMSNCAIFSGALPATGTESVESLYNYGTPPNIASYSNLQGWWELDASATFDGSNWSIPDASSNSNTGTSSGMTAASLTQSNLIINQSYDPFSLLFDGSNDYIDCGNDSSLQIFTNSHTQSFWINTSGFSQGYIGGYGVDSVIIYFSNNTIRFYTKGLAQPDFYSNTVLSVNQWNHIVCTYESGGDKKIYINGNLDNTISTSGSITTEGVGYTIAARNLTGTISNYFDGSISNGSIYSSALTSAQIKTLYNEGKPFDLNTFAVTPVSWWRLGAVNSSYNSTTSEWTVLDEVGNNNGTGSNLGPAQTALSDGVGATGSGTSSGMSSGTNRTGDAPYSENNAVSYNMSVLAKSSSVPT